MTSRKDQIRNLRFIVFDFDGVFTDNRVLCDQDGREAVWCDRSDSLGIKMVRACLPHIRLAVISKETNPVVAARCQKLQMECYSGIDEKGTLFARLVREAGIPMDQAAFMGNDINDRECIRMAGIGVAVGDAMPAAREVAAIVTRRPGGHGAIREFLDMVLEVHEKNPYRTGE